MKRQASSASSTDGLELSFTAKSNPLFLKILLIASLMVVIAGSLTGVITYMNIGFTSEYLSSWMSSFVLVVILMMPIGMGMTVLITKLINRLIPKKSEGVRNLIIGIIMAIVMESFMALVGTLNNIEFHNASEFYIRWLNGFLGALPLGLIIMLVMSMGMKPRIEQFIKN